MAITLLRQETQLRNSETYDDTIAPSEANFETNPAQGESDFNNIRSMLSHLRDNQAGEWWDALTAPTALETGTARGVQDVNDALHAVEKKRVLKCIWGLKSISIAGAGDIVDILGAGELPGNLTAAVGAVTTLGTVVSTGSTMGTADLNEVAGGTAISPKNLVHIVDAGTRDPILDGGDRIYGLLQGETGLADGDTILDAVSDRVQISFVKVSSNDLVAIASGAMDGKSYDYCYVERVRLEDLNEADFLGNADVDVPAGSTVDRQTADDNQGATPVNWTNNVINDLEGPGLAYRIRDDLEATLFDIIEGSAGGTSQFNIHSAVDEFDVDAIVNNFDNGVSVDTGAAGTTINLGVTANQIDSGGALTVASGGSGILRMSAAGNLEFGDQYEAASGYDTPLVLSDASAEWDAFETAFGEVSLLNAIVQAKNTTGRRKVVSTCTVNAAADADVSGPSNDNNLDTDLGDLSAGTFVTDYDIYLNGSLQVNGANAAANEDVYPGTALANGQLKFEKKVRVGDKITVIDWAE